MIRCIFATHVPFDDKYQSIPRLILCMSFILLQRAPFGCWFTHIDYSKLLHNKSRFIIFSPIYSRANPIPIDIIVIRAPLTTSVNHIKHSVLNLSTSSFLNGVYFDSKTMLMKLSHSSGRNLICNSVTLLSILIRYLLILSSNLCIPNKSIL